MFLCSREGWEIRKKSKKEGRKEEKGKKKENRVEKRKEIVSKKEGKYPFFVSMFNIGPYDRERFFWVAIIYTPDLY